jgi:hypothetical protein
MRAVGFFVLALAASRLTDVIGQEEAESDIDLDDEDDMDVDLEEESNVKPPMGGQAEPVEDFDLGLTAPEQKARMASCYQFTLMRSQARKEKLMEASQEIAQQHGVSVEQGQNQLLYHWMLSCYMSIEPHHIQKGAAGTPITEELEQELFGPSRHHKQTAMTASRRQHALLESTIKEVQEAAQRQGGPGGPQQPAYVDNSMLSGSNGVIFMLIIFAVIFGGGALIVLKLNQVSDKERSKKDRLSKAEKRAAEAAKKSSGKKK